MSMRDHSNDTIVDDANEILLEGEMLLVSGRAIVACREQGLLNRFV